MPKSLKRAWISASAIERIRAEVSVHGSNETGGVLLGYIAKSEVVITRATPAGPLAVHTGESYVPDQTFDEQQIYDEYEKSGGITTYLGDWHSHPDGGFLLSLRDRRTLMRISNFAAAQLKTPVMMIAFGNTADLKAVVYTIERWLRTWPQFKSLPLRTFDDACRI